MDKVITAAIVIVLVVGAYFFLTKKSENPLQNDNVNMDAFTKGNQKQNPTQAAAPAQLQIGDIQVGTGEAVKAGDTIAINYRGMLTNGQEFDSSYKRNQPLETQIGVGRVIKGWDQGVIGMKVGGKRRLVIPPDLAYGAQGVPGVIPPNATLIFDLELLEIK